MPSIAFVSFFEWLIKRGLVFSARCGKIPAIRANTRIYDERISANNKQYTMCMYMYMYIIKKGFLEIKTNIFYFFGHEIKKSTNLRSNWLTDWLNVYTTSQSISRSDSQSASQLARRRESSNTLAIQRFSLVPLKVSWPYQQRNTIEYKCHFYRWLLTLFIKQLPWFSAK